jgi:hypothetical protein
MAKKCRSALNLLVGGARCYPFHIRVVFILNVEYNDYCFVLIGSLFVLEPQLGQVELYNGIQTAVLVCFGFYNVVQLGPNVEKSNRLM